MSERGCYNGQNGALLAGGASRGKVFAIAAGLSLACCSQVLVAATPVNIDVGGTMLGYGPAATGANMDGTWMLGSLAGPPDNGGDISAGAFTIDITLYGGSPYVMDPSVGFCAELGQSFTLGASYNAPFSSYQHDTVEALSASTAGADEGAGIAAGGIGITKAEYLQILFDQAYAGTTLASWTEESAAAFQLALWKLTHEAASPPSPSTLDLGLSYGSGAHFGHDGTASAPSASLYTAADTLVSSVLTAHATYSGPTTWDLIALTDVNNQDFITAVLIPEPTSWALGSGLGLMALVGVRRWRRRGTGA